MKTYIDFRKACLFALAFVFICAAHSAVALNDRVVAVVNDQVITQAQLDARATLNIRQMGIKDPSAEQKKSVEKRTLSTLIDEELQKQYAERIGISVSAKEIERAQQGAIENMGETNWKSLIQGMQASADEKLGAEIRWQKIMANDIRPRVTIGTAEVDRLIEELAKNRQVLEREISMILINPAEDGNDKPQLEKLNELKSKIAGGADFAEMAKAYSDDKSAVNGGMLGWFTSGELNPQLEEALDKMQPGQVSDAIRTPLGWHLVKLDNVRTTKPVETKPVTEVEIFLLASTSTSDTALTAEIQKKMNEATRALTKPFVVRDYFAKKQYGDVFSGSAALGWVNVDDLQPEIQTAIANTKQGQWSQEVSIGTDFGRVYVADTRQAMPRNLDVYRERVTANLLDNRMELASRRFMRELRQRAFVDIRL